jgi:hypothetical protein
MSRFAGVSDAASGEQESTGEFQGSSQIFSIVSAQSQFPPHALFFMSSSLHGINNLQNHQALTKFYLLSFPCERILALIKCLQQVLGRRIKNYASGNPFYLARKGIGSHPQRGSGSRGIRGHTSVNG